MTLCAFALVFSGVTGFTGAFLLCELFPVLQAVPYVLWAIFGFIWGFWVMDWCLEHERTLSGILFRSRGVVGRFPISSLVINFFAKRKKPFRTFSGHDDILFKFARPSIERDASLQVGKSQVVDDVIFEDREWRFPGIDVSPGALNFVGLFNFPKYDFPHGDPFFKPRVIRKRACVSGVFVPLDNPLNNDAANDAADRAEQNKDSRDKWGPIHKISSRKRVVWKRHLMRRGRGRATAFGRKVNPRAALKREPSCPEFNASGKIAEW